MAEAAKKIEEAPELPEIITVQEAAQLLRVNVKTIYAEINAGNAPWAKKLGRVVRINRHALQRWFEQDAPSPRKRR